MMIKFDFERKLVNILYTNLRHFKLHDQDERRFETSVMAD